MRTSDRAYPFRLASHNNGLLRKLGADALRRATTTPRARQRGSSACRPLSPFLALGTLPPVVRGRRIASPRPRLRRRARLAGGPDRAADDPGRPGDARKEDHDHRSGDRPPDRHDSASRSPTARPSPAGRRLRSRKSCAGPSRCSVSRSRCRTFSASGLGTAVMVVVAMAATLVSGVLFARLFGRGDLYGALAGAATAVCGASAALATASVASALPGARVRHGLHGHHGQHPRDRRDDRLSGALPVPRLRSAHDRRLSRGDDP